MGTLTANWSNGNTIFCNYLGHGHLGEQSHFFELTPDKKIVWEFADHVNFKLDKGGESIGLYVLSGTNIVQVDAITFGAQTENVSQGRYPDGSTNIYTLSTTTPRGPNSAPVASNHAPVLAAIANRVIYLGRSVDFFASATDSDAGQTLSYSLLPGFPTGASINAADGHFQWIPSPAQAPSTSARGANAFGVL